MRTKVAIIGGGVAGVWLSLVLAEKGVNPLVIDYEGLGSHASTRNQGWVHCGAYYAAQGSPQVASDCSKSHKLILDFINQNVPDAALSGVDCYYQFRSQKEVERFRQDLGECGFSCPDQLEATEAYLVCGSQVVKSLVRVNDIPVNTEKLLSTLAQKASAKGAAFHMTKSHILSMDLKKSDGGWTIQVDGDTIHADCLVLCCGVLIPAVLKKLKVEHLGVRFNQTRVAVAVLHKPVSKSLLVVPYDELQEGFPNVSPFFTDSIDGVSICMTNRDEEISAVSDDEFLEVELRVLQKRLLEFYPRLKDIISQGGNIPAHFYVCQKLELAGVSSEVHRLPIILDHLVGPNGSVDNLVSFYPGKFTSTPAAVSEVCDLVMSKIPSGGNYPPLNKGVTQVARRKYYDDPAWELCISDGILKFVKP